MSLKMSEIVVFSEQQNKILLKYKTIDKGIIKSNCIKLIHVIETNTGGIKYGQGLRWYGCCF